MTKHSHKTKKNLKFKRLCNEDSQCAHSMATLDQPKELTEEHWFSNKTENGISQKDMCE